MKQGSLSVLKPLLCQQEKWEKDYNKCHICNKEFIIFVRRRHHCRFCGKIFCSNCSDHFINGAYIDSALEQFLRLCNPCYIMIQAKIKEIKNKSRWSSEKRNIQIIEDRKSNPRSEQQSQQSITCIDLFQNQQTFCNEKQQSEQFNNEIKKKIQCLSQYLCQSYQFESSWVPNIIKIALKAISDTKIDTLVSNESIDITRYIKITIVNTNESNATKYIKGYIVSQSITSKYNQWSRTNPKILLIAKSLEIHEITSEKMNSLDSKIKQKQILRKRVQEIINLKPDIIFIQENANTSAVQQLESNKIIVIQNVKEEVFNMIQKVTQIKKVLKKLYKIQKYNPDELIGTCERIYFNTYENTKQSKTLLVIENEVGINSIILGGIDMEKLEILKILIQRILRVTRHLYLESYLLDNESTKVNKNKNEFNNSNFCTFLDQNFQNIIKFQQKHIFRYTRVNFAFSKYANYPDLNKVDINQYFNNINYRIDWKVKEESQICSDPEYKQIGYYSEDDVALGSYLFIKIENANRKCDYCYLARYKHQVIYYHKDAVIKIKIETKEKIKNPSKKEIKEIDEIIETNTGEGSGNKREIHERNSINFKLMTSYMECSDCGLKLSDPFQLKHNYLEYSFIYFLQKLFLSVNLQTRDPILSCTHDKFYRVFKYENILVKFMVQKLLKFQVDNVQYASPCSIQYLSQLQEKFLKSFVLKEFIGLKTSSQILLDYFKINCANLFLSSSNNPKRNLFKNQIMINIIQTICKLKEIIGKLNSKIEEINENYDKMDKMGNKSQYFNIIRKSHEFYYLIDAIIKIVEFIQYTLKKTKIQDLFQEKNVENLYQHQDTPLPMANTNNTSSTNNSKQMLKKNELSHFNLENILQQYKNIRWATQENAILSYIPVYSEDPISLIAYALNSSKFKDFRKENPNQKQIKVRIPFCDTCIFPSEYSNDLESIKANLKMQKSNKKSKQDIYEVTIFYNEEFQIIRQKESLNFQDFIKALVGCRSWDNSGGKSLSRFAKSYNDLIVIKIINDKEFIEFRKFVSSYTSYVNQAKNTSHESLLAKIFGMFEVNIKGKVYNCIAMQNIFFGLKIEDLIVYDLKGSETNRFAQPHNGKIFTGLDTNFKVDRNGEPVALKEDAYNKLMQVLDNDCKFLNEQMVIDYSLLLIINVNTNKIRLGIIDFMRPYHIKEKLETIYKELKTGGSPTVIPPNQYSQRFTIAMKKYFIKVFE